MQGLELARKYYETYGIDMIRDNFPDMEDRIAVGIVGNGSECYGYDDEISRDHDYLAGFAMWLTREDEEKIGFPLMRKYHKLPDEFEGITLKKESLYGSSKFGVFVIEDFYERLIGMTHPPRAWQEWLYTPEEALATATNGEVFRDDLGEFKAFRNALLHDMPEDVRRKKIAANLAYMAQSGQYNYSRCLKHGEAGAAQLALYEFVEHAIAVIFNLNRVYRPYYKWQFRRMRQLPILGGLGVELETMICGNFASRRMITSTGESAAYIMANQAELCDKIEEICHMIVEELQRQGLTAIDENYLEPQAVAVMQGIRNREIASLHIMEL